MEQILINSVRFIADCRGYTEVNDKWLDGDILELLSECQFDLPKAIAQLEEIVKAN